MGATPAAATGGKLLHAALVSSVPAADARLASAPQSIRLVFNEAVVADLSRIITIAPGGRTTSLRVALDPRDAKVLIGTPGALEDGSHRVEWRIVSADGHPVAGNFSFSVAQSPVDSALFPPIIPQPGPTRGNPGSVPVSSEADDAWKEIPKTTSLLRGLGLGAMMAGVGLLFFGSAARNRRNLNPDSVVVRFFGFGAVLLAAHMAAWLYHLSPGTGLSGPFGLSTLTSTLGMVESARVLLALLSLLAIANGMRGLALFLGIACLAVSGAIGHTAAVNPMLAIPAKVVHLLGAAIWIGGLVWLGWTFRRDITAFRIEARRVSSAALVALIAVAGSGITQMLLFLDWRTLPSSDYGKIVMAKITGLLILMLLGAYNRFSLVPNLDDSRKGRKLSRSVTQELVLMFVIIVLGGILANVPLPPPVAAAGTAVLD